MISLHHVWALQHPWKGSHFRLWPCVVHWAKGMCLDNLMMVQFWSLWAQPWRISQPHCSSNPHIKLVRSCVHSVPSHSQWPAIVATFTMVSGHVALGIYTPLYLVPIYLSEMHQTKLQVLLELYWPGPLCWCEQAIQCKGHPCDVSCLSTDFKFSFIYTLRRRYLQHSQNQKCKGHAMDDQLPSLPTNSRNRPYKSRQKPEGCLEIDRQ